MKYLALICAIMVGYAQATPVLAVSYTVTDLGTLGGRNSDAVGINNRGEVVGASLITGDRYAHAFVYRNGTMVDLGTLGGPSSQAMDINESGQIVGSADNAAERSHAFLYDSGSMIDVGSLVGPTAANAINASGQIVGSDYVGGFLASNGLMNRLDTFATNVYDLLGINDAGQIVGWYSTIGTLQQYSQQHAFLYSNGSVLDLHPLLGPSAHSMATDINAAGQVVGLGYVVDGAPHAFLYSGGMVTDLGSLAERESAALAINSGGEVVGYCMDPNAGEQRRGFVYRDGQMYDLNALLDRPSAWKIQIASDINDLGQIAAVGVADGNYHALLLTPVPEPSSFTLIAFGVAGTVMWCRRRIGNHR